MDTEKVIKFKPLSSIYQLLLGQTDELIEIFELTFSEALVWLNAFKWNYDKFTEFYTNSSEKNIQTKREDIGLSVCKNSSTKITQNTICPVCITNTQSIILSCGHYICRECFNSYITEKAPQQVFVKCFYDECQLIIPFDIIEQNYQDFTIYKRFLTKQYARDNNSIKTCDNQECDYCVEDIYLQKIVECICRQIFCLRCSEGDHRPADCEQVRDWRLANLSQDKQTLEYIQNSTKFCPKCRQPIEKDQGCNHMICKPPQGCGHEFCWLCLKPWSEHTKETGGHYVCNSYQQANQFQKKNDFNSLNKDKSSLEKFIFYSVRYEAHDKAEIKAINRKNKFMNKLKTQSGLLSDVDFLEKSFNFLIKARHILKYTYCYGYYFSKLKDANLALFEFNQADFERGCENLHFMLEEKWKKKIYKNPIEYQKLRQQILNQQVSTEQFMEKFLKELSN